VDKAAVGEGDAENRITTHDSLVFIDEEKHWTSYDIWGSSQPSVFDLVAAKIECYKPLKHPVIT
jgi:hypothetical protein